MASPVAPRRRFLAEPIETTSRSSTRQPSDRSDVSPSPSNDSDSASSSMAVLTGPSLPTGLNNTAEHKDAVEHLEHIQEDDVQMQDVNHGGSLGAVNGTPGSESLQVKDESDKTTRHKPRRKFAPEPVEISTRSSHKERGDETSITRNTKRRFAPEPIETTSKSSKNKEVSQEEEKPSRPRRKFAVEPVETSSTSSKDREKKTDGIENGARPKRRFAVEPVETSTRSSKEKEVDEATKPRRKFAVEPVETSASSSSLRKKRDDPSTNPGEDKETPSRSSSGGRKFSPELVGTAKASFRKIRPVGSAVPKWLRDEVAEDEGSLSAPEAPESKFSAANLARKARADPRRHSYTVPDLPMIQSDSSDEENASPQTPGSISQCNSREKVPKVSKHSHNHEHQKHLDDLKTLREQAVAAYGQQEDHVPFGHYGGDSEDEDYSVSVGKLSIQDDADPSLFRRMSHHDLHLVMEDMRHHHEQLEKAKRDLQEDTAGISRFSAAALAARHHLHISHPAGSTYHSRHETHKEQQGGDDELAKMRKAASPPMQGNEIKFPFSISPKMTRCDPDQAPRPRRANSEEEEEHDIGLEGMWSVHVSPTQHDAPAGLWGGLCQQDEAGLTRPATPMRSGLQTPAFEVGNPFESRTPGRGHKTPRRVQAFAGSAFLPLTPPRSKQEKTHDSFTAALDQKLGIERQIDEEFSPRVITQIYNYLSLGYPPLARPFDEELSKISRISIVEMRKDDRSASGTMKGHVGAPETEGDAHEDEDGRVRGCRRWEALRLYVREWARQSPGFAEQRQLPNIGTGMWGNNAPVRKGSWGH
ncbi:hypothetical protein OHC33_008077 [Knufia fluminis]|uniref:Uncharacterized protein n=1 Tax=Knufia fluminis TaxID=191047 RepID=A0AAN8I5F3_9EURO|nr:hypothetical protein OHC33_008077 [Knufia fluminis]